MQNTPFNCTCLRLGAVVILCAAIAVFGADLAAGGASASSAPRQFRGAMLGSVTEREFRDLAAVGATLVRFQIVESWKTFAGENEEALFAAWLDKKLDLLEKAIGWGRQYGIKVCVDFHTSVGGFTPEKHNSNMIFVEKKYEDIFIASWERIARRFRGNADVVYGYDILNEPMDRENGLTRTSWRAVMCRAIEAVRAIDPDTPIVVEPNCHATPRGYDVKNIYGLKGFEPLPYDNLIYSVHVYNPLDYTHQGIYEKVEDYIPRPYPGWSRKLDSGRVRVAGDDGEDDGVEGVRWDKDFLRQDLQSVRDFQLASGARIFVGEFSAAAYAPGADRYLRDLCELFEEYCWDWCYHAFREYPGWSVEYEGPDKDHLVQAKELTPRAKVLLEFLTHSERSNHHE